MRHPRTRVLVAALCLALAGCGGDDHDTDDPAARDARALKECPDPKTTPAERTPDGGVLVRAKCIRFVPQDLTVKVGQRITWRNDDRVPHTIESKPGEPAITKGPYPRHLPPTATYSFTPRKAARIDYRCPLHDPVHVGTITVTE